MAPTQQDDRSRVACEDVRYPFQLRSEARAFLLNWIHVRETAELAQRDLCMSNFPPSASPPSLYIRGESPPRAGMDPPFWHSQAELLKHVQEDLAEAEEFGLTVADTLALYPYMVGSYPTTHTTK
jgi:hypothetical protein